MIPADVRLISAKICSSFQATLTGESLPVERWKRRTRVKASAVERSNACFLGTSVESGTAKAVVIATARTTYFGHIAAALPANKRKRVSTAGVKRYTWLMIRFMLVMVPLVFVINGLTKHNWHDAFFFSMQWP